MSLNVATANRDIGALQPLAQEACKLFMLECQAQGLSIFITETHRSQARQDYLYSLGRTEPGNVVTWTTMSRHTAGMAWDIAVNPPNNLYDKQILAEAGKIAKDLGIAWGGDWHTPDMPHFEISEGWEKDLSLIVEKIVEEKLSTYFKALGELPASEWAVAEIEKAKELGISDGTRPQALAKREEVIAMTQRAIYNLREEMGLI